MGNAKGGGWIVEDAGGVTMKDRKVGFTCGAFDLFHAGHVLMLQEAKEVCDYLVVGLQIDPSVDRKEKNSPIQTMDERKIQLLGCRYVDEVLVYGTEAALLWFLQDRKFDIRILGADWRGKPFTGHDLPTPVFFNSRNHKWSTSYLRQRVVEAEARQSVSTSGVALRGGLQVSLPPSGVV